MYDDEYIRKINEKKYIKNISFILRVTRRKGARTIATVLEGIGVSIFPRLRTFLKVYIIEQNIPCKTEIVGERKEGGGERARVQYAVINPHVR